MKHLDEIGETYWQHFIFAVRLSLVLLIAGVLVIIHAFFPQIFKNVGSDVINHAHKILTERKEGSDDE